MKRKQLKKGHKTVEVDGSGFPRDATGHRTDLPAVYSADGRRCWRAEELEYGLGQRVRAVKPDSTYPQYQRMAQGECGTIMNVPEFILREYYVLPDSMMARFFKRRSGLYLARMPEHYLEPE